MTWIKQEDPLGCACAALAMILGRTYAEVKSDFAGSRDFVGRGISYQDADDYLACRGYATARKWIYRLSDMRAEWPPEPFGKVHICEVVCSPTSPASHVVVMLEDGSVIDPLTPERKRLMDYHKVCNVAAVVKMA